MATVAMLLSRSRKAGDDRRYLEGAESRFGGIQPIQLTDSTPLVGNNAHPYPPRARRVGVSFHSQGNGFKFWMFSCTRFLVNSAAVSGTATDLDRKRAPTPILTAIELTNSAKLTSFFAEVTNFFTH